MRRFLRRLVPVAGVLLGLVVLAGILLAVALYSSWGSRFLRDQINAQLAKTFIGGAHVGRVEGGPFTELVLHDLVIDGPDGRPAIEVGTVRGRVPLLPLLAHRVRVEALVAEDVVVEVRRDAQGRLELAHLTRPGPPSRWDLELASVALHRGRVSYHAGGPRIDLDGIELGGHARLPHGGPIDAAVVVRATWRQRTAPVVLAAVVHRGRERTSFPAAIAVVRDAVVAAAGVDVPARGPASGTVVVRAPAATVAQLFPGTRLPGDLAVAVQATPAAPWTQLVMRGALDRAPLFGVGRVDLHARTGSGVVTAADLDLGRLTRGAVAGTGGLVAAVQAAGGGGPWPRVTGMITAWTRIAGEPPGAVNVAIDAAGARLRIAAAVANDGGLEAGIGATVRRQGGVTTLEEATVRARTRDVARATGGATPVHGALEANLAARGELAPHAALAIAGTVDGHDLRAAGLAVGALRLAIDARGLPASPRGAARLELRDVTRGRVHLAAVTAGARSRSDGKLAVALRTAPASAPWRLDAEALVTPGRTVEVALQRAVVRIAGGATWRGDRGRIAIGPERIEVAELAAASRDGRFAASGSYTRRGPRAGDLAARLSGALALAALGPAHRGRVTGDVRIARRGGLWSGTLDGKARGVRWRPGWRLELSGDAHVAARPGRVTGSAHVASSRAGAVDAAFDLRAPADLADARAWRALPRGAIHRLALRLSGVELAPIAELAGRPGARGRVDGSVALTPTTVQAALRVHGLAAPRLAELGAISGELHLAPGAGHELHATARATLARAGKLALDAHTAMPARVLDPAAWRRLWPAGIHDATLRLDQLVFGPGTLAELGLRAPYRGRLAAELEVGRGVRSAELKVDLDQLRGGVLAQPISVHLEAQSDAGATGGVGYVRTGRIRLLDARAHLGISLARLLASPRAARTAPLAVTATIPSVPARPLLAVLGTTEVTGGTLTGTLGLGGSVARPTATADLVARDVSVPPPGGGAPEKLLTRLALRGAWDGRAGTLAITGDETGGGTLRIALSGDTRAPKAAVATLQAKALQIEPLAAFLPGPAGGVGGRLDAALSIHGLDPRTMRLAGWLHAQQARIPISPVVGTLFHGDVKLVIAQHAARVTARGKLGGGDVQLQGTVPLDGAAPRGGALRLAVDRVQLISKTQPIVSGKIAAHLGRSGGQWTGVVVVEQGKVQIPSSKGHELAPVGAPKDLVFAGQAPPRASGGRSARPAPALPALVTTIDLRDVHVDSKEVRGDVAGKLTALLGGPRGLRLIGTVTLDSGDLDLFGRRYHVERATAAFDGPIDPVLDIRLTHDFPEVTTVTEIHGRLSKPELRLTSDPGTYTTGQLLGFLLGGEPSGDPNAAMSAQQRVESAGASYLAGLVGGYVKQALPVDIDVLRYQGASATSSAAVTVGTWLTDQLFVAYRHHLAAHPDENASEAQVEYWILRRLSLEATIGDRGYDAIDLLWRRRW